MYGVYLGYVVKIADMLLNLNSKNGDTYAVRLRIVTTQTIYAIRLANKSDSIYITKMRDAPELTNKTLHQWDFMTTYPTLIIKEITNSVERANVLNMLEVDRVIDEIVRE